MDTTLSLPTRDSKIVSDGVMGMILLLAAEAMFFAGLISAYIVNRAGAMIDWPPANQPRLPIEVTAVNTAILIGSAISMFLFAKKFKSGRSSLLLLTISILLGAAFVTVQGTEWVKLLGFGLTTTSSLFGAFFYLIIGAHALHVTAGLAILFYLYFSIKNSGSKEDAQNKIIVCSLYWYFVVGIWPILYYLVYLL